ncbi:fatty-acid-binding protein 1 [Impatiens glandulifera]|uniref:fatty-acid-binding protein 1 n=1 Tax=Impatiens glandulifera TaxID=253017 RepID=UPI001FB110C3|nr:fatty-acid-binding protein 1 [Impatiens glandulifera]
MFYLPILDLRKRGIEMVGLRFPFLFSQPPIKNPPPRFPSFSSSVVACTLVGAGTVAVAAVSISKNSSNPILQNTLNFFFSNFSPNNPVSYGWGSLSLASDSPPVTQTRTGMAFPSVIGNSQRLLGVGMRKKCLMGLKNIDVYSFGVYADDGDIKEVLASGSQVNGQKTLIEDIMENDIRTTVRLQIVYGRLSIGSVRSAFAESVGNRLKKFGGSDNKELLNSFTSQFKDEYKIPKGSIIDISREKGNVLRTTIDGNEIGSIQSQLLCRSILDLYIGDDPFDQKAKKDVETSLASLVQK